MDIQRYALMIALALVGWMTLVEWNAFRLEHAPDRAPVAAVEQGATASPEMAPATPADLTEGKSAPAASDLPTEHSQAVAPEPTEKTEPTNDVIHVKTDTLLVQISLVGGDIVGVSLPKFHAELGRADLPFRLLQQSADRNYTAQSGLIGPNGTDTAEGRPQFRSEQTSWQLADGQDALVVVLKHTTDAGVSMEKRYTFTRGSYIATLEYVVANGSQQPWQAALFGQLRRDDSADPSAACS